MSTISTSEASELSAFAGRFDKSLGAELVLLDSSRVGRFYTSAGGRLSTLNAYPY